MNCLLVQDRAAADRSVDQRDGEFADGSVGDWAVMGGEPELVAVHAEDRGVERLTQASGALCDHVEHRLDVSWRTTDHAEDLGSRRLLSEAVGQLMVASLQLLEQPHVLDRDHRLIGEGLDQGDLILRERMDLTTPQSSHAKQRVLAKERHREYRPHVLLAHEFRR